MSIDAKLKELGIELPKPPTPVGFYVPVLRTGNLVITSGQLPIVGKEVAFEGEVGGRLSEVDGQNAARICVINALAQIKSFLGSLDKVKRVVRLEGYVQCVDGFHEQPHVLNAASELLVGLFGEAGKHTRVAVGVSEMPLNAAVQLSLWVEVE